MGSMTLRDAIGAARDGDYAAARRGFSVIARTTASGVERATCLNNIAVLETLLHGPEPGLAAFSALDSAACSPAAAHNIEFLRRQFSSFAPRRDDASAGHRQIKVALLSLLFNWPSTGGGTVHTKELAEFLSRDGYQVRHLYATYAPWGLGQVRERLPYDAIAVEFSDEEWTPSVIRQRFRAEVDRFSPDVIIITDSWNTKPLLAEAVGGEQGYPYFLRIAALECLCPLNNVRLLVDRDGQVRQCDRLQLADSQSCHDCVQENARLCGPLHQQERLLAGFHEPDYPQRLRLAFEKAAGVLAVNPAIAQLVAPYAQAVHVVPSGFDPQRFEFAELARQIDGERKQRLLFAGLVNEFMKGFHVLLAAGELLWRRRQDFEIWATADPVGEYNEFTRFMGWQSQEALPRVLRDCDMLVFPTLAQEALGRTAVEAMACGKPVIASRLGGLPWVVEEGVTGLLCNPSDPGALAEAIASLLDDPRRCEELGQAGRAKFLRDFTWSSILERSYRPLLCRLGAART